MTCAFSSVRRQSCRMTCLSSCACLTLRSSSVTTAHVHNWCWNDSWRSPGSQFSHCDLTQEQMGPVGQEWFYFVCDITIHTVRWWVSIHTQASPSFISLVYQMSVGSVLNHRTGQICDHIKCWFDLFSNVIKHLNLLGFKSLNYQKQTNCCSWKGGKDKRPDLIWCRILSMLWAGVPQVGD